MLLVSALFTAGGILIGASGDSFGWLAGGFFGLCFLVALFEDRLPRPRLGFGYRLVMTGDDVACEHPKRKRESIRWENVNRIWFVTLPCGPRLPDEWILLEGDDGGCSFPTEASGFDGFWDELERRYPGFDYEPMIRGGTEEARHLCWERRPPGDRES
jgi:hypothetical protein